MRRELVEQLRASSITGRTETEQKRLRAMSLLDESLTIFCDLGMRPMMERVLFRREILGHKRRTVG